MKPRDIFIKACNEIAIPFIAMGFKPSKNGQCLKKISKHYCPVKAGKSVFEIVET